MFAPRTISASVRVTPRQAAPGFIDASLDGGGPLDLDPFLSITDFRMSEPIFAPHPHAGFSAVTYAFPDSAGAFTNRDSLGDRSRIGAGALHWTQAAAGMMHEEVPEVRGIETHGLQLFVNLPADRELAPPQAFHLDGDEVPELRPAPGVLLRVVVGEQQGVRSPVGPLLHPIAMIDAHLDAGSTAELELDPEARAVLLVVAGSVRVGDDELAQHVVATAEGPSPLLRLEAGSDGAEVLVLAGRPIREPVVFGGSFALSSPERLADARRRYDRGEMGSLAPSF
jgi:redox-sensitive bicupin YhaK (pirin superfamily)